MSKTKVKIERFLAILYFYITKFISLFIHEDDFFLISERGEDARDNAWHFAKYLQLHRPDIKFYYVITDDSPDKHKLDELGIKTVRYQSLKHYLLLHKAKVCISTHIMGYTPNRYIFRKLEQKLNKRLFKGKRVFLQHGITSAEIPFLSGNNLDIFICTSPVETEIIKRAGYNKEIREIGFCRFDNLYQEIPQKGQILIMPTWRKFLKTCSDEDFSESTYAMAYNSLLNNKNILNLLEKYNLRIVFYPHHEFQDKIHLFQTKSDRITIASEKEYDVQDLLKSSSVLITDHSSVFFDFAYQMKPVIYYCFDDKDFYEKHGHEKSDAFVYERGGFGPVIYTENKLIDAITSIVENNQDLSLEYMERVQKFFTYTDADNCKRTLNAILDL